LANTAAAAIPTPPMSANSCARDLCIATDWM
jgi:hypothetical protein